MADDQPSGHTFLDFNAPLSHERAARLIASLGTPPGATVLDLGCGWAELLLRLLAAEPTATGLGVDTDEEGIGRGRENAAARGLTDRVRLEVADATGCADVGDVVISVGSSHAWGGTGPALAALRARTRPGGRVLFGDAVWDRPPTAEALAAFGADDGDLPTLAGLVDLALDAGFRLIALSAASLDEWDDFESRYCAGRERWLLDHPGHPDAETVRAVVDAHRRGWLTGYRGVLGFAYCTFAVPAH